MSCPSTCPPSRLQCHPFPVWPFRGSDVVSVLASLRGIRRNATHRHRLTRYRKSLPFWTPSSAPRTVPHQSCQMVTQAAVHGKRLGDEPQRTTAEATPASRGNNHRSGETSRADHCRRPNVSQLTLPPDPPMQAIIILITLIPFPGDRPMLIPALRYHPAT